MLDKFSLLLRLLLLLPGETEPLSCDAVWPLDSLRNVQEGEKVKSDLGVKLK